VAGIDFVFGVESMISGYQDYQLIWNNPLISKELRCEFKPGNSHNMYAVAVKKEISIRNQIVGHVRRSISTICSLSIRRDRLLVCIINGPQRYSSDLPHSGLEIPCKSIFKSAKVNGKTAAVDAISGNIYSYLSTGWGTNASRCT